MLQCRRWLSADDVIGARGVRAAWPRVLARSGRRDGGGGRREVVGTQWCNKGGAVGAPERRWGVLLDVLRARGPLEFAGRRDPRTAGGVMTVRI